ncbi:hypothetical protein KS4_01950 [Poriferisphaera corsica]|uniref:Uncharacterized protein n=1 Tax=Poriferisphaera corsica TaxID=2528020 RepID=A0A517YPL9_9BACT|nr:hypothetical protein [Poriferisphaera corsica]QDU32166.1 hypothetical protein KS4_01950 [Poriferisphaera corsica]
MSTNQSDATSQYCPFKLRRFCLKAFFLYLPFLIIFILFPIYLLWHAYLDYRIDSEIQAVRDRQGHNLITAQDLTEKYEVIDEPNLADYLNFHISVLAKSDDKYTADNNPKDPETATPAQLAATLFPGMTPYELDEWTSINQTPPDILISATENYLKAQQPVLDPLLNLPPYQTAVWTKNYNDGIAVLLPHLGNLRRAARTLKIYNWLAVHQNRSQDSLRALTSLKHFADSLNNEPILITYLVNISIRSLLYEQIELGLNHHIYNDSQLQQLAALAEPINVKDSFLHSMLGERAALLHYLDNIYKNPKFTMDFAGDPIPYPVVFLQHHLGLLKTDTLAAIKLHNKVYDEFQKPIPDISSLDDQIVDLNRLTTMHTRYIFPALGAADQSFEKVHHKAVTLQIALAIERFYLANRDEVSSLHEALPNDLHELVPDYLAAVPVDMTLGKSGRGKIAAPEYQYIHDDHGYIIYTLGRDKTDNLGCPFNSNGNITNGNPNDPSDITTAVTFPGSQQNILQSQYPQAYQKFADNITTAHEEYFSFINTKDPDDQSN